jgi:protein TonB
MKRFTFLVLILFLFFSSNFSLFGQTQNEDEEEIIEVESNCDLDENIEIIIEDVEIEMSCQGDWSVTAIEAPRKEEQIFYIVEQSAVFEGGMDNFYDVLNNQMHFSETMKEGRVFIQYVIDTTGKMTDMKVVKGLSEENDKEALRIMNLINEYYTWQPAEQRSKKVKVRMCLPVVFKREKKVESNVERIYEK